MEIINKNQQDEAKLFTEHYLDLASHHCDTLLYYLSENAIFDWFGKTVKGQKNIKTFLKETLTTVDHDFANPSPVPKIGFRDTHIIKLSTLETRKRSIESTEYTPQSSEKTPPKRTTPMPTGSTKEMGQGDGVHNCIQSPTKKIRLDLGECIITPKVKYVQAEGSVTFHKKSSKKLQKETTWSRPCSLEMAYTGTTPSDFTIHLVIYRGNVRCRRNLLKEFDAVHD